MGCRLSPFSCCFPPVVVDLTQRVNGWKTAKRPGVDYFLAYLSQFYEIVLFTSQPLYVSSAQVSL